MPTFEGAIGINYGFDKVRFLTPVPVGARVRGRFVLSEFTPRNAREVTTRYAGTVEIEGAARPALVADWTDEAIDRLHRGGHDMVKIHAAYHRAAQHRGQPTVILAQTKKGFGMGSAGQGKMTTHQQKKLDDEALLAFRDRFALPISDADCLALKRRA
ncbi:hypothetical protein G6F50_014429 [Rhizopus delemar]|uniref:Uncharacterized protein n=1 Tax=Rhizopus delemar TaxID=936053 RepID=A0A9P7C8A1_9FUNG|nr:hypothetical protein G6F50_014429 [Rhizopus delemar]